MLKTHRSQYDDDELGQAGSRAALFARAHSTRRGALVHTWLAATAAPRAGATVVKLIATAGASLCADRMATVGDFARVQLDQREQQRKIRQLNS